MKSWIAASIGLGASVASLIDSIGAPQFCGDGCATVRETWWAHPFGIPMAAFGVAFFVAALAVGGRPRKALAAGGAAWALVLLAIQAFVIGAWCKLCVVADASAIAFGALAWMTPAARSWRSALMAVPVAALTMGALRLWTAPAAEPAVSASSLPACVAKERRANEVTIVEFVDFECPFCRRMAKRLDDAIAAAHVPVHVVRKMDPLKMHAGAMPAALAWCCADRQGKGDAMATALFTADDLSPESCERLAAAVGCDLARYRLDLPAAADRVAADLADASSANVHGLPTLFIDNDRVVGASLSTAELVARLRS